MMVESNGPGKFDNTLIDDAWRCVVNKTNIERDLHSWNEQELNELSDLVRLMERLNNLNRFDDPTKLIAHSKLLAENGEHLERIWHDSKQMDNKDWSVDVVIGNSLIRKSLHLKVNLVIGTHKVEMNVDKFGALRYEVARVLQKMEAYL